MGSKKTSVRKNIKTRVHSDNDVISSLISALRLTTSLNAGALKRIYSVLLIFSKRHLRSGYPEELCILSELLFENVQTRFEEFYIGLFDSFNLVAPGIELKLLLDELTLLLRCCMVMFGLLEDNQGHQFQKGLILLRLLRTIIPVGLGHDNQKHSITFRKLPMPKSSLDYETAASDCTVEIPAPWFSYFIPVLEVFADELLMNKTTRKHLILFDSLSSKSMFIFRNQFSHASIACVLEVITAHFILSFSLRNTSDWLKAFSPEISLEAALTLPLNPVLSSSPIIFQSHLISLIADSISVCVSPCEVKLDHRFMDCCCIAYETALSIFFKHMSSFQIQIPNLEISTSSVDVSFDSFILPSSKHLLLQIISNCETPTGFSSRVAYPDHISLMIDNLMSKSFVSELNYMEDIVSFLSEVMQQLSSDAEVLKEIDIRVEDALLLGSILKLISCSMAHLLRFGLHAKILKYTRFSENVSPYIDYLLVNGLKCNIPPKKLSESKCLILFVSTLLPLCYASKMESSVDNCLRIMAILCLMVIAEDGHPHGLRYLSSLERISTLCVDDDCMSLRRTRNFYVKFVKIRSQMHGAKMEKEIPDVTNSTRGDAFLKGMMGRKAQALSDYDDLADFIECEAGKDYCAWLHDRSRFRAWKQKKRECRALQKRRMAWNSLRQPAMSTRKLRKR